jgi:hypothetical protein
MLKQHPQHLRFGAAGIRNISWIKWSQRYYADRDALSWALHIMRLMALSWATICCATSISTTSRAAPRPSTFA